MRNWISGSHVAVLIGIVAAWSSVSAAADTSEHAVLDRLGQIIGLAPKYRIGADRASVIDFADSTTPFLGQYARSRRVWQVVFDNPVLNGRNDSVLAPGGTITASVDSASGILLKVVWDVAPLDTALDVELSAPYAETSMRNSNESYAGFPDSVSPVSFAVAVFACPYGPLDARQIIGQYVLWSDVGRPARPVWVITLRGIAPIEPMGGPSYDRERDIIPEYQRNRVRCIVSVPSGKCIRSGTIPPVPLKPADRERLFGK